MIDNYDSFTYIIVQYFQKLNYEVVVRLNNAITLNEIASLAPQAIVIGPGPGRPEDAGISLDIINQFAGQIPILGICLGHQAIAMVYGAKIVQAKQVMHGRVSAIYHRQQGVFTKLPSPINMTRYHSLVIDKNTLPDTLEITGWTQTEDDKLNEHSTSGHNHSDDSNIHYLGCIEDIMAIRHRNLALEGVQFHPESILSKAGLKLLNNFMHSYHIKQSDTKLTS